MRFTSVGGACTPSARSMRMSSGPSRWKLKPRSASSSCSELDAEVEQDRRPRRSPAEALGDLAVVGVLEPHAVAEGRERARARARAPPRRGRSRAGGRRARCARRIAPRRGRRGPRCRRRSSPPGLTPSSSSVSASRTGMRGPRRHIRSRTREHAPVVVGEGLLLEQPLRGAASGSTPRGGSAGRARSLRPPSPRSRAASCGITTRPCLSMVTVWPKKFTRSRKRSFDGLRGRHLGQPALDLEPHRHRIEAHVLAGDAGDEELRRRTACSTSARKPLGILSRPLSSMRAGWFPRSIQSPSPSAAESSRRVSSAVADDGTREATFLHKIPPRSLGVGPSGCQGENALPAWVFPVDDGAWRAGLRRGAGREGPLDVEGDVLEQALRVARRTTSQRSGAQTSNRFRTPMTTASRSRPAAARSAGGQQDAALHVELAVDGAAGQQARERLGRAAERRAACASCSSSRAHSDGRVGGQALIERGDDDAPAPSPSARRNTAGTGSRPFGSIRWR